MNANVTGNAAAGENPSWDPEISFDAKQNSSTALLAGTRGCPPRIAWVRSLDSGAAALKEFSVTFSEAMKNLPLGYRLWNHNQREKSEGRIPVIDPFSRESQPWACHGVPLGGMGACSIGRGFQGDFNRWNFVPGKCDTTSVGANQFSVFVRRSSANGLERYSSVLYPGRHRDAKAKEGGVGIGSWNWGLGGARATYFGLMPRAWTLYGEQPDPELNIVCRQVSPFIAHNYQESSLPCCVFIFTLANNGAQSADVSINFTFANSLGGLASSKSNHSNQVFSEDQGVHGVLLHHRTPTLGGPATLAIAAREGDGVSVSLCPTFSLSSKESEDMPSASTMWQRLEQDGHLDTPDSSDPSRSQSAGRSHKPRARIAAAVCGEVTVPPRSTREVAFALAWDVPIAKFSRASSYYRRYTQFYGQHGRAAPKIARDALLGYHRWEKALDQWQLPVLTNPALPDWYRVTLFNELYFLVAGGTVWTDGGSRLEERSVREWQRALEPVNSVGRSVRLVPWTKGKGGAEETVSRQAGRAAPKPPRQGPPSRSKSPQGAVSHTNGSKSPLPTSTPPHGSQHDGVGWAAPEEGAVCSSPADLGEMEPQQKGKSLNDASWEGYRGLGAHQGQRSPHSTAGSPLHVASNSRLPAGVGSPVRMERTQSEPTLAQVPAGFKAHELFPPGGPRASLGPGAGTPSRGRRGQRARALFGTEDGGGDGRFSASWARWSGVTLLSDGEDNVGQFLYLEGLEYIMWNTYDVHFYASFALLANFPKLELAVQRDFAVSTLLEQQRAVTFLADGHSGITKVRGSVPHDLGVHEPWTRPNAYNIHDTSRWKDLNAKFVLQIYRDVSATGDLDFARAVWPAVEAAITYLEKFDRDGDGLIENDGFPDQTYDNWSVHGVSCYCGGLWLAALRAGAALALLVQESRVAEKWAEMCAKGLKAFDEKLWNGRYFNYDSGNGPNSKSIQADQLAGQWYLLASNLPGLFDNKKACKALQMVFEYNVMKVGNGYMGAINGMSPDGTVDESCLQSREVWTGVTYAVAAVMIHEGMVPQAFRTAEGIFRAGWESHGYWYQTPEGWDVQGRFRALSYMRPLSIWAMQWALKTPSQIPTLKDSHERDG